MKLKNMLWGIGPAGHTEGVWTHRGRDKHTGEEERFTKKMLFGTLEGGQTHRRHKKHKKRLLNFWTDGPTN